MNRAEMRRKAREFEDLANYNIYEELGLNREKV